MSFNFKVGKLYRFDDSDVVILVLGHKGSPHIAAITRRHVEVVVAIGREGYIHNELFLDSDWWHEVA